MGKIFGFGLALVFGTAGISRAVDCVITPTGTSAGYASAQEAYLFVFSGTQPYRLGLMTDEKAKFRYATVLTAISLGKNIRLSYYGLNTTNNCADIFQQDGNLTYVQME